MRNAYALAETMTMDAFLAAAFVAPIAIIIAIIIPA
jgi:hypothetical protein